MSAIAYGSGSGGGKGGGGSTRVAQEDANTLRSNSIVRTVHLISTGPCYGLADGDKSIIFDETRLQAASGSYNFTGVTGHVRLGTPDQDYIPGFPVGSSSISVNTQVKYNLPVVRTISGPVDAARVTIRIPALMHQDAANGDLLKTNLSVSLWKRPYGTSTWTKVVQRDYLDKCTEPYEESYRIELGGTGDWDIKFSRDYADAPDSTYRNDSYWAYLTSITDGKFQYPNCALFGLALDASLFGGNVPTVSFDWKGRIVKIPSNYNPATRVYTGIWDGTFTTGWTDNPAWILYCVLTDPDDGLGDILDETYVDKYALYDIGAYCDEMVDNGFGGKEPRYTFNYQFTQQTDAFAAIQIIAASFRGFAYWAGGVRFFADMPADPVVDFNQTNVINGIFTYESTGLSARHSAVAVTWFDPDDLCRPTVESVDDPELIASYGYREVALTAYGCTSRGLALRFGKWLLDTEKTSTDTVSFASAYIAAGLSPGDIITVTDPDYSGLRYGGTIASSTTTSITPDFPTFLTPGRGPFVLILSAPDGTRVTRTLTNDEGVADTFTFDMPLDDLPVDGSRWNLSSSEVSPRQFRVIGIKDNNDSTYSITALFHDPAKYARIESDIVINPLSYTRYSKDAPSPPIAIGFTEYLYRYNTGLRSGVTVTVTPPESSDLIRGHEIQIQVDGGDWQTSGEIQTTTYDFKNTASGPHYIRARVFSLIGIPSAWTTKYADLFSQSAPPADVANFRANVVDDRITFLWDENADLDLDYYVVRYSPLTSGAVWSASNLYADVVRGTSLTGSALSGTFLIKAVDLSGVESTNAVSVVNTITPSLNAIAALSDWPGWGGILDEGLEISSGELRLKDGHNRGVYTFALTSGGGGSVISGSVNVPSVSNIISVSDMFGASAFVLDGVFTSRLSYLVDAYATSGADAWGDQPGPWGEMGKWADADPTLWSAKIEYIGSPDDPAGFPDESLWKELIVGDYSAKTYYFRLVLARTSTSVTPYVSNATVYIDMPDRVDSKYDLVSSTSGSSVAFSPAFKNAPTVNITGKNMATGDYFTLSNVTRTGFDIIFKNISGSGVSRTYNYQANGWGRESV